MLGPAAQTLIETVKNPSTTPADIQAAAQAVFDALKQASADESARALLALAPAITLPDARRGAFVATLCGAFVERGIDPAPIEVPIVERLRALLPSCVAFADACKAETPDAVAEDQDPEELFQRTRERLGRAMPGEAAAWATLEALWPPMIAVFSVSRRARAMVRDLRDLAGRISDVSTAGHWLRFMLFVLDDEPLLVVEPATELGIMATMSGIVDNFQLHVLLMDVFPQRGWFKRRRVAARIADIARGNGPQSVDEAVTGHWNLYSWQAVRPDLSLPDSNDPTHWIWGEGIPDDIPQFENRRVVVLGPPSYARSWGAQRLFAQLRASIEVQQTLSSNEVRDWLQRMASTPRTTP